MILIPGGVFSMGREAKAARPDERPVHQVKVDPPLMDATEVTNQEFSRFTKPHTMSLQPRKHHEWRMPWLNYSRVLRHQILTY